MNVTCPACAAALHVEDEAAGRPIRCTCGMTFVATPSSMLSPTRSAPARTSRRVPPPLLVALGVLVVSMAGVAAALYYTHGIPGLATVPDVRSGATTLGDGAKSNESTKEEEAAPPGPPVASLSGVALWDRFGLKEAESRRKYVDKVVEITVRGKTGLTPDGRPYFGGVVIPQTRKTAAQLSRLSAQERQWEETGYPPNLICYYPSQRADEFKNLAPDRDVVLRGLCVGRKRAANVDMGYVVVLENCEVVSPGR